MAIVRAGHKFIVADSLDDLNGLFPPNGWSAAVRDSNPNIIAKVYKKIDDVWTFQYNQGDAKTLSDKLKVTITVGTSAPDDPSVNDIWIDTN